MVFLDPLEIPSFFQIKMGEKEQKQEEDDNEEEEEEENDAE